MQSFWNKRGGQQQQDATRPQEPAILQWSEQNRKLFFVSIDKHEANKGIYVQTISFRGRVCL